MTDHHFRASVIRSSIILSICLGLALTAAVKAEVPTPAPVGGLSVSPDTLIIKELDIGKTNTVTFTNNSPQKIELTGQEGIVIRNSEKKVVPVNEAVTTQILEITPAEFSIEPGATFELKVRTRFTATAITDKFPAVIIKTKNGSTSDVNLNFEIYVPVLIQNLSGEYKLTTDLKINVDRFTLDPNLTVDGNVKNEGGKFFTPSGTVILSKNGTVLAEKEVTTQINTLQFPNESADFSVNLAIPDTTFKGVGEYIIESHVGSDLSGNKIVARIKFIYIPKELVYLTGGVLLGIVAVAVLARIIRRPKKTAQG